MKAMKKAQTMNSYLVKAASAKARPAPIRKRAEPLRPQPTRQKRPNAAKRK